MFRAFEVWTGGKQGAEDSRGTAGKLGILEGDAKGLTSQRVISTIEDKKRLLDACLETVRDRVRQISTSLDEAREASFSETKSSAGDKYETGREMMRMQSDMRALQLYEAQDLLNRLERIDVSLPHDKVRTGSVVKTSAGLFFVSQSMGRIELDGLEYQTISLAAPMGKSLKGLGSGDSILVRDQRIEILAVL